MFKNIWLIFRHTKMLVIKRRGQTMGEHYTKIIRHYNAILGHKRRLLMDSKNQIYGQISHSIRNANSI